MSLFFLIGGSHKLWQSLQNWTQGDELVLVNQKSLRLLGQSEHWWDGILSSYFMFCISLVFFLVSLDFLKKAQRKKGLVISHHNEPWMWREDWAKGEIPALSLLTIMPTSLSTIAPLIVVISFCLLFLIRFSHSWISLDIKVIPIMGLPLFGLLIAMKGLLGILRTRVNGIPRLVMTGKYGLLGGSLAAKFILPKYLLRDRGNSVGPIRLDWELKCVQRSARTKSGNYKTVENVIWQRTGSTETRAINNNLEFPIQAELPFDLASSNSDHADGIGGKIEWSLNIKNTPQIAKSFYLFEIPVFRGLRSDRSFTQASQIERDLEKLSPNHERHIFQDLKVSTPSGDLLKIAFRPGVAKSAGRGFALLGLLFASVGAGLGSATIFRWNRGSFFDIPPAMLCVFVGVILVRAGLHVMFLRVDLELYPKELVLHHTFLGRHSIRRIPYTDINATNVKVGIKYNQESWWDLELKVKGRRLPIGLSIQVPDKLEVLWLQREIEQRRPHKHQQVS